MTTIGCASPARASLYWQSLLPRVGAFSAHCGNSKILRPGQKQCLTWSFDCGAKGTRTPDPHTASYVIRSILGFLDLSAFCSICLLKCNDARSSYLDLSTSFSVYLKLCGLCAVCAV